MRELKALGSTPDNKRLKRPSNELTAADLSKAISAFNPILKLGKSTTSLKFVNELAGHFNDLGKMQVQGVLGKLKEILSRSEDVIDVPIADSVSKYVQLLSSTIHDAEKFPIAFERLKQDRSMTKVKVVEIASAISFPMAKSTTKKAALKHIWDQHETSRTVGAKIEAQRGKSAA